QDTWAITDAYHYAQQQNNSDTGANGVNQVAYTWELGNGLTLTAGADEVRRKSLLNFANSAAVRVSAEPANAFRGQEWPDSQLDFISRGDHAGIGMRYAVGASGFGTGGSQSIPGLFGSDNQVAVGWITDGVFFGHCAQNVNVPVGTFTSPGPLCRADAQQIQLTTT